jgi:hypothetical protein
MLANIESIFDDITIRCQELNKKYSIPQQQTQIKDIQLRIQRVSRLIQVKIFIYHFINCFNILFRKHRNILIKFVIKNMNVIIFLNN